MADFKFDNVSGTAAEIETISTPNQPAPGGQSVQDSSTWNWNQFAGNLISGASNLFAQNRPQPVIIQQPERPNNTLIIVGLVVVAAAVYFFTRKK